MKKILIILTCCLLLNICNATATLTPENSPLLEQSPELKPGILALALKAYQEAKQKHLVKRELLTIVDYSLPSTLPRMWVLDLTNNQVLHHVLVSHGKNSGNILPASFSNKSNSHKSSLGTFLTGKSYFGINGYSMRLNGLEAGINDHAFIRNIVFHGARYVSEQFIKSHGYLGRSWGCLALDSNIAKKVINTIKGGSLIFVYAANENWLKHSTFLS